MDIHEYRTIVNAANSLSPERKTLNLYRKYDHRGSENQIDNTLSGASGYKLNC
jgi:hypothetical protein